MCEWGSVMHVFLEGWELIYMDINEFINVLLVGSPHKMVLPIFNFLGWKVVRLFSKGVT